MFQLVLTKVDLTTHHIILKNLIELKKERSSWMRGALPQPFLIRCVAVSFPYHKFGILLCYSINYAFVKLLIARSN